MGYISFEDFVQSGRISLKHSNYWSALSVALMLPSICARLEYEGNKEFQNKKGNWKDRECYITWCKSYLSSNGWLLYTLGESFDCVLYNLRCSIVHAGDIAFTVDGKECLFITGKYGGTTELTNQKIIDIADLCNCIFDSVDLWRSNFGRLNFKSTFVFNTNNYGDRSEYFNLCTDENNK